MSKYLMITVWGCLVMVVLIVPGVLHAQSHDPQSTIRKGTPLTFSAIDKTSRGVQIPLLNLLATYGEAYDCFFTIEEGWTDGESINSLSSQSIEKPSVNEEFHQDLLYDMEEVRQRIPNFAFESDRQNPRIIHIIDTRLATYTNYGLERTINSIDFKGTVDGLIREIGKQGISIAPPPFMFTGESQDIFTKVQVKGDHVPVRVALSNFLNLKKRSRIIWIARTPLDQPGISHVHYR